MGRWVILSLPISSSLFVIELSDDLVGLALGFGVVVRLFYLSLANLSNNQVPPLTISLFPAIFTDNNEFFDDLIVRVSGAAYFCFKPWIKSWIKIDKTLAAME